MTTACNYDSSPCCQSIYIDLHLAKAKFGTPAFKSEQTQKALKSENVELRERVLTALFQTLQMFCARLF